MDRETAAIVGVIRALGFIGNSHYCASCLNEFHADRGQHESDCETLADLRADGDWWEIRRIYLHGRMNTR